MKLCEVEDCIRRATARGYCPSHYNRLKRYGDPLHPVKRRGPASPDERFELYADRSGMCWVWSGPMFSNGYGVLYVGNRAHLAHRWAYERFVGGIAHGMQVDHICMNRACVNPEHLRLATNKQNNEHQTLHLNNTTGHRGVSIESRTRRYRARAFHDGVEYSAGTHSTIEEAAEAARQLRLRLFTHNDLDRRGSR